jgi:hypothetical protein
MKLTKAKLQQIIKEELNSVLEGEDWYETMADRKYADQESRPSAAQEWLNTQDMARVQGNDSAGYMRLVSLLTTDSEKYRRKLGFPAVKDDEAREMIDSALSRYAEEHPGMEPSTDSDPEGHRRSAASYYDEIGNTEGT